MPQYEMLKYRAGPSLHPTGGAAFGVQWKNLMPSLSRAWNGEMYNEDLRANRKVYEREAMQLTAMDENEPAPGLSLQGVLYSLTSSLAAFESNIQQKTQELQANITQNMLTNPIDLSSFSVEWNKLVAIANPFLIGPRNVGLSDQDTQQMNQLIEEKLLSGLVGFRAAVIGSGYQTMVITNYEVLSSADPTKNIIKMIEANNYMPVPFGRQRNLPPGVQPVPAAAAVAAAAAPVMPEMGPGGIDFLPRPRLGNQPYQQIRLPLTAPRNVIPPEQQQHLEDVYAQYPPEEGEVQVHQGRAVRRPNMADAEAQMQAEMADAGEQARAEMADAGEQARAEMADAGAQAGETTQERKARVAKKFRDLMEKTLEADKKKAVEAAKKGAQILVKWGQLVQSKTTSPEQRRLLLAKRGVAKMLSDKIKKLDSTRAQLQVADVQGERNRAQIGNLEGALSDTQESLRLAKQNLLQSRQEIDDLTSDLSSALGSAITAVASVQRPSSAMTPDVFPRRESSAVIGATSSPGPRVSPNFGSPQSTVSRPKTPARVARLDTPSPGSSSGFASARMQYTPSSQNEPDYEGEDVSQLPGTMRSSTDELFDRNLENFKLYRGASGLGAPLGKLKTWLDDNHKDFKQNSNWTIKETIQNMAEKNIVLPSNWFNPTPPPPRRDMSPRRDTNATQKKNMDNFIAYKGGDVKTKLGVLKKWLEVNHPDFVISDRWKLATDFMQMMATENIALPLNWHTQKSLSGRGYSGSYGRGRWTDYGGPDFAKSTARVYKNMSIGGASQRRPRTAPAVPTYMDYHDEYNDSTNVGQGYSGGRSEMMNTECREAHLDQTWKGLPKRLGAEARYKKMRGVGLTKPKEFY